MWVRRALLVATFLGAAWTWTAVSAGSAAAQTADPAPVAERGAGTSSSPWLVEVDPLGEPLHEAPVPRGHGPAPGADAPLTPAEEALQETPEGDPPSSPAGGQGSGPPGTTTPGASPAGEATTPQAPPGLPAADHTDTRLPPAAPADADAPAPGPPDAEPPATAPAVAHGDTVPARKPPGTPAAPARVRAAPGGGATPTSTPVSTPTTAPAASGPSAVATTPAGGAAPPEVAVPEVTAPEVTAPEVTAPEVTAPEVAAPDATPPGSGAQDVGLAPDRGAASTEAPPCLPDDGPSAAPTAGHVPGGASAGPGSPVADPADRVRRAAGPTAVVDSDDRPATAPPVPTAPAPAPVPLAPPAPPVPAAPGGPSAAAHASPAASGPGGQDTWGSAVAVLPAASVAASAGAAVLPPSGRAATVCTPDEPGSRPD